MTAGALALLLSTPGCQATMPSQDQTPSARAQTAGEIVPNEFPMRFEVHQFQPHCYNTIGCTIIYNGRYQIEDSADYLRPGPSGMDYQERWGTLEIGIMNFPAPAQVEWRSLDGAAHKATVDFGEIFKDRLVLHSVPEQDIPEGWVGTQHPEIHLEVNDRTINVYMRTHIATKSLQEPGNRYSNFRVETVKAWSMKF